MSPVSETEVYLDERGGGPVLVGRLTPSFLGNQTLASASFAYDPAYLSRPDRYPISPDLPLRAGETYTAESYNLFGAFSDAAPDEWGQKVIVAGHALKVKADPSLPRRIGDFDFLLAVSDFTRMGALRLKRPGDSRWLSSDSPLADIHDLDRVITAARRYEADEANDEEIAYLYDIATSAGGARPKANVVGADGNLAIAKLPHSKDGNHDVERWEAVALTMARRIGSAVPEFETLRASENRSVLVVRRFDRKGKEGRVGYISASTAMGLGANNDHRVTYEEFSDTITEMSADAPADLREMFGRIGLSVLINNADDHWKNHGFLRHGSGWRLSPVFDVNPSPRHGQITARAISDADDPRDRDIRNLLEIADAYNLSRDHAAAIIRSVAETVEEWPTIATGVGIPERQQRLMVGAFNEGQLEIAKSMSPQPRRAQPGRMTTTASSREVWVRPHTRNGVTIAGHWRDSRPAGD